ncbi:MAG: DUF4350 domain-containing protein [Fuerstiella sp.]|nr:DUF4350 domain-containing protein [Fuerstiella sp.]
MRPVTKVTDTVIGTLTSRHAGFRLILVTAAVLAGHKIGAAEFTSVEVGYQRQAQVGRWMPIRTSAEGLSPGQSVSLTITSPDPRGNSVFRICETQTVAPDGSVSLSGLGRTGRLDDQLQIDLIDTKDSEILCSALIQCSKDTLEPEDNPVQKALHVYRHNVRFLLTVGQPPGITELLSQAKALSPEAPVLVGVSVDTVSQLPREPRAYELFSIILLTGPIEFSDQQFDALKSWIHAGGRLIICCNERFNDSLTSPLRRWLDERFDISPETRRVTDVDLNALQRIVPRSSRIPTRREDVRMNLIRATQPFRLAESTNGPLAARTMCGGGQVTVVTLDFSQSPLSGWTSLADFYAILMTGAPLSRSAAVGNSSRISSSGVSDLSTQLMASVDPIPDVGRWTTWSVMSLAFVWLLLIGPVDYFLVVILLKRPHFTWVTFPVWVTIGFVTLYGFKSGTSDVVMNSVHVIDVSQDQNDYPLQVYSLMSLSVPETKQIQLRGIPSPKYCGEASNLSLKWTGRAEDVYGGMYRSTGIGAGDQKYSCRDEIPDTITALPVLSDSSFECQAHWSNESAKPLVESSLSVSGFGILKGGFQHQLPVALRDWIVVFGNRVYRPRDDARMSLPAGEKWEFQRGGTQISDLKAWLNGDREVRTPPTRKPPGQSNSSVPYNLLGRDALDIVTMMTLFNAAGAEGYTRLRHDLLRRLEFSESIEMNYAVVIGWAEEPATLFEMDESAVTETSSLSIVRLMLPVERRPGQPSVLSDQPESADQSASDTPSANEAN